MPAIARNAIGAEIRRYWFDSEAVLSATTVAERKVFSRLGYMIMRDARQAIRRRKRPSRPGESPTNQTSLLKRFIFFEYEPENHGVVSGPARLSGTDNSESPRTLEEGSARIDARPYMRPAYDRHRAKLPQMWRDAI